MYRGHEGPRNCTLRPPALLSAGIHSRTTHSNLFPLLKAIGRQFEHPSFRGSSENKGTLLNVIVSIFPRCQKALTLVLRTHKLLLMSPSGEMTERPKVLAC